MTKTHLIKDESLGGVLREYVEVDREANVGEYVYVFGHIQEKANGIFKVDSVDVYPRLRVIHYGIYGTPYNDGEAYRTLEPTDIIHVDGKRYRMVDRKADVGEKVLDLHDQKRPIKTTVPAPYNFDAVWYSFETENGRDIAPLRQNEYRVLEPIEPSDSQLDIIARLIEKVAQLEQENTDIKQEIERLKQRLESTNRVLDLI